MGIRIGIPIALSAGRVMAEQFYGVSAYNPEILGIAIFVLALSDMRGTDSREACYVRAADACFAD